MNKNLADKILNFDKSINSIFNKLTVMYWALKDFKNNDTSNKDTDKNLSYLKSYLSRNITSYGSYNLSQNIVLLSNKISSKQNKNVELFKSFGLGDAGALKYIKDPVFQQLYKYYSAREIELKSKYDNFLKTIFKSVNLIKSVEKDWNLYVENEMNNSARLDEDERIIIENYRNNNFSPGNIISISKIRCSKKRTGFIAMLEQMTKKLLIRLETNDDIPLIVDMHFTFDEIGEESASLSNEDSKYKYIKWWGQTPKLVYFVKQLLVQHIIIAPPKDDLESIIVSHFYYAKKYRHYTRKDVQDAESNTLNNKHQKPLGFEEIDNLLNDLK